MLFIREGRESILGPEIRYPKVYLGLPPGWDGIPLPNLFAWV
jgi:hypothetical protein